MVLLNQTPTGKELILSPFPSSAYKENENKIVRGLFPPGKHRADQAGFI